MKSTNQRPILPQPPIMSARWPEPVPLVATLICSWVASEERISIRIRFSARSGDTPSSVAALRAPMMTVRSRW